MRKGRFLNIVFPGLSPIKKMGSLRCPDCNEPMVPYSVQNIVIDKCETCGGVWFDRNEFGTFKSALNEADLSRVQTIDKPVEQDGVYISTCPRCDSPLFDASHAYNSGVTVKKCDGCGGQWLPYIQAVNLLELIKMSQDLAPDIKGLATEIKFHEKKLEKSKQLKKMGNQLRRGVPLWRYYMAKSFIVLLPLYDDNPRQIFPFATVGLIAINLLVFIFAPSNTLVLHAGLLHLLVNMFFLWIFGDNVEEKLGPAKYLSLYLTCGLVASLLQSLMTPAMVSPTVAASGAVAGVLGSYIYYFPHVNIKTLVVGYIVDLPTWVHFGLWLCLQGFIVTRYLPEVGSGVIWWANLFGFGCGLAMGGLLAPKK